MATGDTGDKRPVVQTDEAAASVLAVARSTNGNPMSVTTKTPLTRREIIDETPDCVTTTMVA
jgi:hypothetical protein